VSGNLLDPSCPHSELPFERRGEFYSLGQLSPLSAPSGSWQLSDFSTSCARPAWRFFSGRRLSPLSGVRAPSSSCAFRDRLSLFCALHHSSFANSSSVFAGSPPTVFQRPYQRSFSAKASRLPFSTIFFFYFPLLRWDKDCRTYFFLTAPLETVLPQHTLSPHPPS